ncbi:SCF ubiquitin ligase complex subunit cdc4 [Savitreella phatthalungensis]
MLFKKPRRRTSDLDPSLYPLQNARTPSALRDFSFELDGRQARFREDESSEHGLFELNETIESLRDHHGRVQSVKIEHTNVPDSSSPTTESRKRAGASLDTGSTNKRRNVSEPHPTNAVSRSAVTDVPGEHDGQTRLSTIAATNAGPGNTTAAQTTTRGTDPIVADVTSPQSLSLPSPSASPRIGASRTIVQDSGLTGILSNFRQAGDMMQIPDMVETFDGLPTNVQSYVVYQLLRRCSKQTLQVVASLVNPALKRDFLDLMPYELSLQVLRYLDVQSLCRATQVSRRWREIVDEDESTWKALFERDGFVMEDNEFQQAIQEGWGLTLRGRQQRLRRMSTLDQALISSPSSFTSGRPTFAKDHFEEMVSGGLKQPLVGQYLYKGIYKHHHVNWKRWMHPRQPPAHLSFESHGRYVVTCLHLDDDKVVTASEDSNINIFDVKTGALRMSLEGHDGGVWAMQIVGDLLVSGSTDRTVRIWDLTTGQCMQVFEGHTSTVRCLVVLPAIKLSPKDDDSHLIVTGSRDSSLRVWRLPKRGEQPFRAVSDNPDSPSSVRSNEEGGAGREARRAENPYLIRTLTGHTQSVRAIAANEDILVSGSYDHSVRVWRISTGAKLWRLSGHNQKVYSVVLDSKRNRCVSGSMDWKVKVWDLEHGSCLWTLEGHSSLVGLLAMSHDLLVSAAADSTLRAWDPETGKQKQVLSAHTGAITCFQHDGDKVISGSDGTLKLWDIKTGAFVRDLMRDLSSVWAVKFDNRRCVAAVQRTVNNQLITFIEVLDFESDGTTVSSHISHEVGRQPVSD